MGGTPLAGADTVAATAFAGAAQTAAAVADAAVSVAAVAGAAVSLNIYAQA